VIPRTSLVPLPDLTGEIARRLPEYLPESRLGVPRFQTLETIKASQMTTIYSCAKWQDAVLKQLGAASLRYPHHIEGEQYLALNLLGSEQKVAAHAIVIPRNGNLNAGDFERFLPLPGSPYPWGDRRRESR
jgi:hypothetical protein